MYAAAETDVLGRSATKAKTENIALAPERASLQLLITLLTKIVNDVTVKYHICNRLGQES